MQPGDCVILNAANSTVGRCLLQLCRLLRLRAVAVVRGGEGEGGSRFEQVEVRLKALGASHVLMDEGSLKVGWVAGGRGMLACIGRCCLRRLHHAALICHGRMHPPSSCMQSSANL